LFLPCLINTSRAIKLIEVAFYHIPRCTLAERIPIYDSICNANRGQSFQLKLFLFHSPLPLFEHITRRIHTIPVLRLCVCARRSLRRAFFSWYIILFVRVAAAVDGDCPSHLQQLSWPPFNRAYIFRVLDIQVRARSLMHIVLRRPWRVNGKSRSSSFTQAREG
jgi:hypothetical protein